jgi:hypothetical protein
MRSYSKRTLQSAAGALGNGNSLILSGSSACALQVTGTFVGTVTFEGHVNEDSATWVAIQGVNANSGTVASTATDAGLFYFSTVGLHGVRARISAYTSGSITVVGREVDMAIMPPSVQVTGATFAKTPGTSAPTEIVLIGGKIGLNGFEARMDAQQNLMVGLRSSAGSEPTITSFNSDSMAAQNGFAVQAIMRGFNESSLDRWRNNTEGTLLASAARTATASSPDQPNHNATSVIVYFNVTVASGTGGVQPIIQYKDPVSGNYVNALVGPSRTTPGMVMLRIAPGLVAGTNAENLPIPRTWRLQVTHADGSSYTYSVGYVLIVG